MIYLKKKINLLAGTALLLFLGIIPTQQSCYFDNEAELYPNQTCDTTDIKYSVEINSIMVKNCYSCHTGTGGQAGIAMETHPLLKNYAHDGTLVLRINDTANPMPPAGLMSECDRQKVESWVKAGAKNN